MSFPSQIFIVVLKSGDVAVNCVEPSRPVCTAFSLLFPAVTQSNDNHSLVQFALSGAAGSPIQYFVSGREGSELAPDKPGQLRYLGTFFVYDWKWINSTDKMDGYGAFSCAASYLYMCIQHNGIAKKLSYN